MLRTAFCQLKTSERIGCVLIWFVWLRTLRGCNFIHSYNSFGIPKAYIYTVMRRYDGTVHLRPVVSLNLGLRPVCNFVGRTLFSHILCWTKIENVKWILTYPLICACKLYAFNHKRTHQTKSPFMSVESKKCNEITGPNCTNGTASIRWTWLMRDPR